MPRKPRIFLPGFPQHIVVRGHNRQPADFDYLFRCLKNATECYQVKIHAWVLMNNHIHLLATPEHERSLSGMMQSLGRRYAGYFNKRYCCSGALWEGRYKTAVVNTDRYFLVCQRYIELNPVRAKMVESPADYLWSSYHCHAAGVEDGLTLPHQLYLQLGQTPELRQSYYQELVQQVIPTPDLNRIRSGTQKGDGIGDSEFVGGCRLVQG